MKQQLSQNWKFHIPDLKVGTLDQLVGLSDDLGKKWLKSAIFLEASIWGNRHVGISYQFSLSYEHFR